MKRFSTIILTALMLCLTGCETYVESDKPAEILKTPKRDYVLAVAVDTSGSFADEMFGKSGRGYRFTLQAVDRLFRDRPGKDDRVLLAQLSANPRAPLWEGTPRSLRKSFGSSEKLKTFIQERSDPAGSRLYAGIAQTLNYIHSLPGVKEGETKVCVLILSDMMDNSPTQAEDKEQMIEALRRLKNAKGQVGLYFVDIGCLESTRQCFTDAGLDSRFIESGIVQDPPLPSFEE